jgi:hypothetical protein
MLITCPQCRLQVEADDPKAEHYQVKIDPASYSETCREADKPGYECSCLQQAIKRAG